MSNEEMRDQLNRACRNTLMETLEMEFSEVDREAGVVKMTMPVNPRVHQPLGLLHGGASAALAESVGSASSLLWVDPGKFSVLGIQLSCNHIRSIREGLVTATARIIHRGRTTHLWEVSITDEQGRLISHCKLTNLIVEQQS